jgi:ferredoxin-NADP reductase
MLGIKYNMTINTFPVVLHDTYMLSSSVKHFSFHSKHVPAFNFLPGQFVTIHFEHQGKMMRRSYSISNPPKEDNCIDFAVGYVKDGVGSELLFNLKIGDTVQFSGPFGRLTLKEENPKRYVFIATSTGVTPFRSMMPELQKRMQTNPDFEVVLMLGVQKREDVLYSQEFVDWARQLAPRMKFMAYLSREDEGFELQPHENLGHVQDGYENLNFNSDEDIVYLCGNPNMIDESFAALKEQGFTTQNIIREKYISSK